MKRAIAGAMGVWAGCEPPPAGHTELDPACGRVVVPVGFGDSEDRGVAALRGADGATTLFGTVDDPTPADSVQRAFWSTVRLTADCAIDGSYGDGGLTTFTVSDPDEQVQRVDLVRPDADGGAVLWGTSTQTDPETGAQWSAITTARVDADGARDDGWGAPFAWVTPPGGSIPGSYEVRAVAAGPVEQVLVAEGGSFAVLATDGAGGTTDAVATFDRESVGPYAANRVDGLVRRADGSMRISGVFVEHDGGAPQVPGVLALTPDGAVDPTFGIDGVGGGGNAGDVESVTGLVELADGSLLVAGVVVVPGRFEGVGVWKLTPGGAVDASFGDHGLAAVDLGEGRLPGDADAHELRAFRVSDDGTMLLGADLYALDAPLDDDAARWHVGIARLLPDGTLDPSFADGGVFEAVGSAHGVETLAGLEQDADGVVTAIGTTDAGDGDLDWVVYRLTPR